MATDKHNDTTSPYLLGNDLTEYDRLELQFKVINNMILGKPIHAPLSDPRRLLEVGCGTGAMIRLLQDRYPDAEEIIGVDLSSYNMRPSQNTTFIQGNFTTMSGNPAYPQLRPASFDFVFSRMLVWGMTNWPSYIAQVKDLLKPGGHVELQELHFDYYDENANQVSDSWTWLNDQTATWLEKGLDIRVGAKLGKMLKRAGFVDVHVSEYRWTVAPWRGHPEADERSNFVQNYNLPLQIAAYATHLGPGKSAEEMKRDVEDMRRDMGLHQNGRWMPYYVAYGRKP